VLTYIRDWVEKRSAPAGACSERKGLRLVAVEWPWLYDTLGRFISYRCRHTTEVLPVMIFSIALIE